MEDKLRALLHGYTGEIDQGIAQSLIDRSKVVAKLTRQRKRQRALVIRAIYLLPGRSDEYLRVVAIEARGILTGRKVKAEKCCIAQNIRYSAVEKNRSQEHVALQVAIQHAGEHQFDKEPGVFFRESVSLNASLFGQYRSCRFNDSPNATQLQMFQQCGLPAAERARQKEKTILDHSRTINRTAPATFGLG